MRWALVMLLVSVVGVADARADVDCPDRKAMDLALWLDGIDPSLEVVLDEVDVATLRVRAIRDRVVVVDRRVARSSDCVALADAIALIIATAIEAEVRAPAPTEPPPATTAREVETPATTDREIGLETAATRLENRTYVVSAGVLWGAAMSDVGSVIFGELDVGIVNQRDRGLRLGLSRDGTSSIGWQLERTAWTARVEAIGHARAAGVWLRGGVGAALVTSRVRSVDTMTTTLRSHPALSGSATVGVPVSDRVSVRADLSTLGFPVADRYRIQGAEAATSPRAAFTIGLGAQIDTDW